MFNLNSLFLKPLPSRNFFFPLKALMLIYVLKILEFCRMQFRNAEVAWGIEFWHWTY